MDYSTYMKMYTEWYKACIIEKDKLLMTEDEWRNEYKYVKDAGISKMFLDKIIYCVKQLKNACDHQDYIWYKDRIAIKTLVTSWTDLSNTARGFVMTPTWGTTCQGVLDGLVAYDIYMAGGIDPLISGIQWCAEYTSQNKDDYGEAFSIFKYKIITGDDCLLYLSDPHCAGKWSDSISNAFIDYLDIGKRKKLTNFLYHNVGITL